MAGLQNVSDYLIFITQTLICFLLVSGCKGFGFFNFVQEQSKSEGILHWFLY